ncbi:MAG: hypothetical protein RL492_1361 [Verrucomicrobiota bacterium]|jgi:hypothetical protein
MIWLRVLFVLWLASVALPAADEAPKSVPVAPRVTPKAIELPAFDLNHPPRAYSEHVLSGWNVYVEKQLIDEDPATAKQAIAKLEAKLGEVAKALPASSLKPLQEVRIFLLYGPKATKGGRSSSFQYFRPGSPKYSPYLDERMSNSVLIFSAYNYNRLDALWSVKGLVHELAHAWHLLHWKEKEPGIYDAWAAAMKAGLYKSDVAAEAKNINTLRYAAQNQLEYFAELSAMYFVGCNYSPSNRAELKAYDRVGYDMIERYWGVGQPLPPYSAPPPR